MKDFSEILNASNAQIKQARVLNVIRTTAAISKQKVEAKLTEFRNLENQIESLLDIRPISTQDLNSCLRNFNPEEFSESLYNLSMEIYTVYQQVIIGINIHNALFRDYKIDGLTGYDKEFIENIVGKVDSTNKLLDDASNDIKGSIEK